MGSKAMADDRDFVSIPKDIATHPSVREAIVHAERETARKKGYVGEACPECMNFTLRRDGVKLSCDTCGSHEKLAEQSVQREPDFPDDGS